VLGEFAAIVEEIVRGAEELRKALVQARTDLASTAAGMKGSIVPAVGGAVLNLDKLREVNAKALSQAWMEAMAEAKGQPSASTAAMLASVTPPVAESPEGKRLLDAISNWMEAMAEAKGQPSASTAAMLASVTPPVAESPEGKRLLDAISKLTQPAEQIARKLGQREEMTRQVREERTRPAGIKSMGHGGLFQRILQSRRGRVWRWKLERSRSPLRQYVGKSLSRFVQHGRLGRLFWDLRQAPRVMKTPQAAQQAARAGMTAQQLARGAQAVGMVGRVGGMVASAAGLATNPIGWAILLIGAATKAAVALHRFARAQEDAVFKVQEMAQRFSRIHAGFAAIEARQAAARLQEERRLATRTLGSAELYARMAERYRKDTEEWRVFDQHLRNLVGYAKVIAAYVVRFFLTGAVIELAIKELNKLMEKLAGENPQPKTTWQQWLEPYQQGNVQLPQRQAPAAPFNRGPKKK